MILLISIDKEYGGFYAKRYEYIKTTTYRLCLGYIAFTLIPVSEDTFESVIKENTIMRRQLSELGIEVARLLEARA